jgi:phosphoribosylamine-glycine ligase
MKILIVGGGGREHALAWKAAQSGQVRYLSRPVMPELNRKTKSAISILLPTTSMHCLNSH